MLKVMFRLKVICSRNGYLCLYVHV